MFMLEYCDDPEKGEVKSSGKTFDDSIAAKYENACRITENYIYLIDMFKIIESCADDLLLVNPWDKDYWKVNKALFNYVNAVYSLKELAKGFIPPIKSITEKYYNEEKWYRFVCDFRNSVIHESVISTLYDKKEVYVNLDRLLEIQRSRRVKPKEEINRQRQITYLEAMKKDAKEYEGLFYYGIKRICRAASLEVQVMQQEVLYYAYEKSIKPKLEWLFSILYKYDETFMYTYIVDKEKGPQSVCEPNYVLENFYHKLEDSLGEESQVWKNVRSLFEGVGYNHFFG